MKVKKKKYALTLLEIMIVIVLIGLIGSVIGFNMKGSLDEGRAFKTERAMEQVTDVLMLEVAKGQPIQRVVDEKDKFLKGSGLVKDAAKILKDGWGEPLEVKIVGQRVKVSSARLTAYKSAKARKTGVAPEPEEVVDDSEV